MEVTSINVNDESVSRKAAEAMEERVNPLKVEGNTPKEKRNQQWTAFCQQEKKSGGSNTPSFISPGTTAGNEKKTQQNKTKL